MIMNRSIVLTSTVINTIKSLDSNQQLSIVAAIAGELILGAVVTNELSQDEKKLYDVIKSNVFRDSQTYDRSLVTTA